MEPLDERTSKILGLVNDPQAFLKELESLEPAQIAKILLHLRAGGTAQPQHEAARDAAKIVADAKLTTELVVAVDRLNRSTTKLAKVGIAVAIVVGIATVIVSIAGIVVPWLTME